MLGDIVGYALINRPSTTGVSVAPMSDFEGQIVRVLMLQLKLLTTIRAMANWLIREQKAYIYNVLAKRSVCFAQTNTAKAEIYTSVTKNVYAGTVAKNGQYSC